MTLKKKRENGLPTPTLLLLGPPLANALCSFIRRPHSTLVVLLCARRFFWCFSEILINLTYRLWLKQLNKKSGSTDSQIEWAGRWDSRRGRPIWILKSSRMASWCQTRASTGSVLLKLHTHKCYYYSAVTHLSAKITHLCIYIYVDIARRG